MKKGDLICIILFAVGLVMMGIGAVSAVFEFGSYSYMGDRYSDGDDMVIDKTEVVLPDNIAAIYTSDMYGELPEIKVDPSLTDGSAVLACKHNKHYNVEPCVDFDDRCYLHNQWTDNFSRYTVNTISIGYASSRDMSELEQFRLFMSDLKNKKIYDYGGSSYTSFTLYVSENDYKRFKKIPDGYDVYTYSGYMSKTNTAEQSE